MGIAITDLFPLKSAKRMLRGLPHPMRRVHGAKASPQARVRPSVIGIETFEPRVLLSADSFVLTGDVSINDFVANPGSVLLKNNLLGDLKTGVEKLTTTLTKSITDKLTAIDDYLDDALPALLTDSGLAPKLSELLGVQNVLTQAGFSAIAVADANADPFADLSAKKVVDYDGDGQMSLADLGRQVLAGVFAAIPADAGISPNEIIAKLNAIDEAVGPFTLKVIVDPTTPFELVHLGGDDYEYVFHFALDLRRTDEFNLDLGRAADALELNYGGGDASTVLGKAAVQSFMRLEAEVGIAVKITRTQVIDDKGDADPGNDEVVSTTITVSTDAPAKGFFVRDDSSLELGAFADLDLPTINDLQLGILNLSSSGGEFNLDASFTATLTGADENGDDLLTTDELNDLTADDIDTATSGDMQLRLPVTVKPITGSASFNDAFTLSPVIVASADPFSDDSQPLSGSSDPRSSLVLSLENFNEINPFRNLDGASLVNVIQGIASMLGQLQNRADLFGLKLPFLQSGKIGEFLGLDGPVQTLVNALTVEGPGGLRVPKFDNVQEFVAELVSALTSILGEAVGVGDIVPTYTLLGGAPTLLFKIRLKGEVNDSIDVDSDLGIDLQPLGNVKLIGSLAVEANAGIAFTLGISLATPADVGITGASTTATLASLFNNASNPVPSTGQLSADASFRFNLAGVGSFEVTLTQAATADNANRQDLAEDLADAINDGIRDKVKELRGYASDQALNDAVAAGQVLLPRVIGTAASSGRLQIISTDSPYLSISNEVATPGAYAELGFAATQSGGTSRLPANGVLSDTASFKLRLGGTTYDIEITAAESQTAVDAAAPDADRLVVLRDLVQSQINGVLGPNQVLVELVGEGGQRQLRISPVSQTVAFLGIDGVSAVAAAELGLLNDSVSGAVTLVGERNLVVVGSTQLAANGVLGADLSLTFSLNQGASSLADTVVQVQQDSTDDNSSPEDLAADIQRMLDQTEINSDTGQTLGDVLLVQVVYRDSKPYLAFVQPQAALDSQLQYALADSLEIAGATGFGIADGSYNVSGPRSDGPGADTSFDIVLKLDNGSTAKGTINVTAAGIDSIAGLVDAINLQIAAQAQLDGKVIAGLQGGRLVFAGLTSSVKVMTLTAVNTTDAAQLGIAEGLSARSFEGVDAFLEDIEIDVGVAGEGALSGGLDFGFVALNLGTVDANFEAQISVDLAKNAPLRLEDIVDGFSGDLIAVLDDGVGNTDTILLLGEPGPDDAAEEEIMITGSANVMVTGPDISIFNGAGGSDDDIVSDLTSELAEAGGAYLEIDWSDIFDLSSLDVNYDLGSIGEFANFGFKDVIRVLQEIVKWLSEFSELSFLNEELPLIGVSLVDTLDFVEDFAQAVEEIANNPAGKIQDLIAKMNEGLAQFPIFDVALDYVANSPGILTFNIGFKRQFIDNLPVDIDLVQLLQDEGVPLPDGVLTLSGGANLAAEFGIDVRLVFGVDVGAISALLDKPALPSSDAVLETIFLVAGDGGSEVTGIDLTAFASASNVSFTGALGPLGVFVSDGGAVINADGTLGSNSPAFFKVRLPDGANNDGRLSLGEILSFSDLFDEIEAEADTLVQLSLGVGAELPIAFPTPSSNLGNLAFNASISNPFDLQVDYNLVSVPDFSQISLENLGLLDTLNLFLAGADTVLGVLGELISGKVFGIDEIADLPFIGGALDEATQFIEDLRNDVIPKIQSAITEATDLVADLFVEIGQIIQSALDTIDAFLPGTKVLLEFDGGGLGKEIDFSALGNVDDAIALVEGLLNSDEFVFVLDLGIGFDVDVKNASLDLEVFAFSLEELNVDFDFDFEIGIGVSLTDGFFLQFGDVGGGKELSVGIEVDLPDGAAASAQLFFLQATVTPEGGNKELQAEFAVDIEGLQDQRLGFSNLGDIGVDVEVGAAVNLDFDLELSIANSMGGAQFPSVLADFEFAWGFGSLVQNDADLANYAPDKPYLALGDIRLDVGDFIKNTIGPFLIDVAEVLEPIRPILDILIDPIPVLSDLLGPTSLLDVAAQFGVVNPALVTALEILDQILDFADSIGSVGEGYITLFDDVFELGGSGGIDLTDPSQAGGLTDPSKALNAVLGELTDIFGSEFGEVAAWIADGFNSGSMGDVIGGTPGGLFGGGGGFSFPFLDDLTQVFGLLFGRNMTLVAYDLAPLEFGFDFSIYVPIWGPLGARFSGGINAIIDLAFGYDTEGFRRFADGGFKNPLELFGGFFVYDDNPFAGKEGIDTPEILVTGKITAAAELNAVVASAGVGGGIFAQIAFDLNDPNSDFRVRIDEILANLWLGIDQLGPAAPIALFDIDAEITARLYAYVEALWGLWRKEFQIGPTIPLYSFSYSVEREPVLATDMEDGTLRLNIGKNAAERVYTQPNSSNTPQDGAETIHVKQLAPNKYAVWGSGPDFNISEADAQIYEGKQAFNLIVGYGGEGDDVVILHDSVTIRAELDGGVGNDELQGGGGGDRILGGSGDDVLRGGAGNDEMRGQVGNDTLEGGADADRLYGDVGADVLLGGAGDDVLLGGADDDLLAGGDGNDTLLGEAGLDLMSGGGNDDKMSGGDGADRMWGDLDFGIVYDGVRPGLQTAGGEPVLVAPTTQGRDLMAGGAGSDELSGNGGNDDIWGDAVFQFDLATFALKLDGGGAPILGLAALGQAGDDSLSGGSGDDRLFGQEGNDVLRGDFIRAFDGADGNVRTWKETNRFLAGVADTLDTGTAGKDLLEGGLGSDTLFGSGNDDTLKGGKENDFLFGNEGADKLDGDAGVDVLFGDDGLVELFVNGVDAGYTVYTVDMKLLKAVVSADDGDDELKSGQDNDYLFGGGGKDLVEGGAGDDVAFGDQGEVRFQFDAGYQRSWAYEMLSIERGVGDDDQMAGGSGRDILIGGKGGDQVAGDVGDEPAEVDSRDILAGDHIRITQTLVKAIDNVNPVVNDVYVVAPTLIESNEDNPADGGNDSLDGKQDDDFLIGGVGDDSLTGGGGRDVVFGDRGRIGFELSPINVGGATIVNLPDRLFVVKYAESMDATSDAYTGVDVATGGDGDDIVIGGGKADTLDGNVGDDLLLGDNGRVDYGLNPAGLEAMRKKIVTTDATELVGGADTVQGGSGKDIIFGGVNNGGIDKLYGLFVGGGAGDGQDIILGDNGVVDYSLDADLSTVDLIRSHVDATPDSTGGVDWLFGQAGSDVLIGGKDADLLYGDDAAANAGDGDGDDMLIGDNASIILRGPFGGAARLTVYGTGVRSITTTDTAEGTGGADTLSGHAGADLMFGGVHGDTMYGYAIGGVGTPAHDAGDILLGDNGLVDFAFGADTDLTTLDLVRSHVGASPDGLGGVDTISGQGGDDLLIGGSAADFLYGNGLGANLLSGDGKDTMLGDNGVIWLRADPDAVRVLYGTGVRSIGTTDTLESTGGADTLHGNAGADLMLGGVNNGGIETIYGDAPTAVAAADGGDVILGDNGLIDFDADGSLATLDLVASELGGRGGVERIYGQAGADLAIGGTAADELYGDDDGASNGAADLDDILLGDNASIELVANNLAASGNDRRLVLGSAVVVIRSTDTVQQPSWSDLIHGNAGADILVGGVAGDSLHGDRTSPSALTNSRDGDDILLGDHALLEWLSTGRLGEFSADVANQNADLYAKYQSGAADTNVATLDLVTAKDPLLGGRDLLVGGNGSDALIGGSDADDLHGDTGNGADGISSAVGNDLLFGDHGRIYPQFSVLTDIRSRNFFSIHIGDADAGEGDRLWGEEGMDILLGGQGDDRLWGGDGDDDLIGGHNAIGGADELSAALVQASIGAQAVNDLLDGGNDNDSLAGDNAIIWRTGVSLSERYRAIGPGGELYAFGNGGETDVYANVAAGAMNDPDGVRGRAVTLLDHSKTTPAGRYGSDVVVGGAQRDQLFGQLGDDLLHGDGSLIAAPAAGVQIGVVGVSPQNLVLVTAAALTDGDDYLEGNGGNDLMYGGLGQDDMIGGSSNLYGLLTPDQRPDGSDRMFGGDGTQTALNSLGDIPGNFDAVRDADQMMGDNATIYRIVTAGAHAKYAYDNYGDAGNSLRVRTVDLLDYTLGGPDYDVTGQANDNGAGDFIRGEAGNDAINGMAGSDILFGDAHDDDLIGGYGHDWISGGTGQDGVLGDDGFIRTSRNGTAEGFFGILAGDYAPIDISTPGKIQQASINPAGALKKSVHMLPMSVDPDWAAIDDEFGYGSATGKMPYADDIIYGGLGSDWLHGGSGDDAMSGAEALPYFFNRAAAGTPSAAKSPNGGDAAGSTVNVGDQLRYNPIDVDGAHERERAGEFALYDEYHPLERIVVTGSDGWSGTRAQPNATVDNATVFDFLLNFQSKSGNQDVDDGSDALFGGTGNDWLVGGTNRDNLYGGWGNDLLNIDDLASTNNGLNDQPDARSDTFYEDRAYGGAGRDVLIANTGGDRLIDWVGEWNSYLVPFAPFGMATVSRTLQPQLPEFLYALSKADGVDISRGGVGDTRNGEPDGELGLVLQKDQAWQDQTGAPADPQAGNIPGGKRDVLRSADFTNGNSQGFVAESGSWSASGGRLTVEPSATSNNKDAISLMYVEDQVPNYFELAATINAIKPVGGFKANAYLIFDYVSPTNFKFAGINVSTNKVEIGQRASWGFQVLASTNMQLKAGQDYNVLLSVNGNAVQFVVDGKTTVSYSFQPRVDALGIAHPIRDGMFGLGGDNAKAYIDNVRVQILPPVITYAPTDGFDTGASLLVPSQGSWTAPAGRLVGSPINGGIALAGNDIAVGAQAYLELSARFSTATGASGGIVFDRYSPTDFKWASFSASGKTVQIGHYNARDGWKVDATLTRNDLVVGTDYTLGVVLKGGTVSVQLNGSTVLSRAYNATVVDGAVGLFARGGTVSFDSFGMKTDDPNAAAQASMTTMQSAAESTTASPSMRVATSPSGAGSSLNLLQGEPMLMTMAGAEAEVGLLSTSVFMPFAFEQPHRMAEGTWQREYELRDLERDVERSLQAGPEMAPRIDWSLPSLQVEQERSSLRRALAADAGKPSVWQEDFVSNLGKRLENPNRLLHVLL